MGKRLYHSMKWCTFHDFLRDYLLGSLGADWANAEQVKPVNARHPIMQWYARAAEQAKTLQVADGTMISGPMTGAIRAFMNLAYNIYLIAHHGDGQAMADIYLRRLRSARADDFTGALFETYAAAAFLKAGFKLEYEETARRSTSCVEFVATWPATGERFSVEVKSRVHDAVAAAAGERQGEAKRLRVGAKLVKALSKAADHTRVVMIEVNVPDRLTETDSLQGWAAAAVSQIRGNETATKADGSLYPPAYVFVTNHAFHHDLTGINGSMQLVADGFRIADFGPDVRYRGYGEILAARKRHAAMMALIESVKTHYEIPSTFNGEMPGSLTATNNIPPLRIGERYLIPDENGTEVPGRLESATVLPTEKLAYPHCRFFEAAERQLERLPELARVLGISESRLSEMAYESEPKTRGLAALRFFGTTVVASDIVSHERRIAPKALRSAGVHKAIWQHGLLPYCPQSFERVINSCRKCGTRLGWYHAVGIGNCGRCKADLLRQPSEQISPEHADGYARMASLLDPCADRVFMPSHPMLRSIGRGACFELGWSLGWALSDIAETGRTFHKKLSATQIAGALSAGDEIIHSWPEGIHLAVERRLESVAPKEQQKILARLRRIAWVKLAWPEITATLMSGFPDLFEPGRKVRRRMVSNVLNGTEAMQQIGVNAARFALLNRSSLLPTVLKSGIERRCDDFDAEQIKPIAGAMASRFSGASVSERLGMTFHGVEQCVCLGLLEEVIEPAVRFLHPQLQVTRESYEALVECFSKAARKDDVPSSAAPLSSSLRIIGGREKPFGPIFADMLAGNLTYWIDSGSARLFQRIRVRIEDISKLPNLSFDRNDHPQFSFATTMNGRDVESALNMTPRPLPNAIEVELGIKPGWKTLAVDEVINLAKKRIAPGEVASRWHLCSPRKSEKLLAGAGIIRVSAAGWCRQEVEAYFDAAPL